MIWWRCCKSHITLELALMQHQCPIERNKIKIVMYSAIQKGSNQKEYKFTKLTWKIGEILHISIIPEPRYCPVLTKNRSRGIPKRRLSSRNCTMNIGPNSMDKIANRLILNMPRVQLKQAKRKLKLWGQRRIYKK